MTDYLGNLGILIEFMSEIVHLVISYNFIAMKYFFCVCVSGVFVVFGDNKVTVDYSQYYFHKFWEEFQLLLFLER